MARSLEDDRFGADASLDLELKKLDELQRQAADSLMAGKYAEVVQKCRAGRATWQALEDKCHARMRVDRRDSGRIMEVEG